MSTQTIEVTVSPAKQYWNGFNAYLFGGQLADCITADERRGWWAALDAQADCATYGINKKEVEYTDSELQEMTEELSDYMQDQDFNRRGGWN